MPVTKYEGSASKDAHHPLLYYDGETDGKEFPKVPAGIPIIRQKLSTATGFNKIYDKDKTPLMELLDYEKANTQVMKNNGRRWWNNVKRNSKNYPDMAKNQSLKKYRGYLTGKPVILIGAGPTLEKNAHLLKKTEITKIAMLHALPYLTKIGVTPEFVLHSDALSDDKVFVTEASKDITLIAHTFLAPALIRKWKGDIAFFDSVATDPYGERLNSMSTADITVKPMGCSMAAGMSIADELMDANAMIFVGCDFAYSENYKKNKKTHVWDGLSISNNEVAGIPSLEAEGVYPGKMKKRIMTCYSYIQYRQTIMGYAQARRFQPPYRRYINASEGGILILPETMTLKKALESVENTTYNVNAA